MMLSQNAFEELRKKFILPWKIRERKGKYYGTWIEDSDGNSICWFWDHHTRNNSEPKPSIREIAYFGPGYTEEAWAEYCCDSHWECSEDYQEAIDFLELIEMHIKHTESNFLWNG